MVGVGKKSSREGEKKAASRREGGMKKKQDKKVDGESWQGGEREDEKKGKKRAELVGDCSRGWSGDKKGWFLKYLSHPHTQAHARIFGNKPTGYRAFGKKKRKKSKKRELKKIHVSGTRIERVGGFLSGSVALVTTGLFSTFFLRFSFLFFLLYFFLFAGFFLLFPFPIFFFLRD